MRMERPADSKLFAKHSEPLLLQKEAENNLPLGIIERWKHSNGGDSTAFMLELYEGDNLVYITLRTPPHLWILPAISTVTRAKIKFLAHFLFENEYEVPGVLGQSEVVQWFVQSWEECSGQKGELHMKQGIYRLDKLKKVTKAEGELVVAKQKDFLFLVDWLLVFSDQTSDSFSRERAEQLACDMIADQKMHFWEVGGNYVSMVCRARSTPNGATVNAVFTPDEFKRNGYATQAVAALTGKLLNDGYQFCALYTDLANSTSNSIYQKIGYKAVDQSLVYHFKKS
ncbi:GNAT family N-acetyltransferase [Halobacillus shinanisalinarum]|uniref:GNAT family N-acetyltransferase n=1 Tax=Halobacillus shinanisalinarum TaxID=2932258 RepID=A0ABY4H6G5_9BACI|nr:GNAT family N-acetyltransferase [Halobacillus shinanisalinarum]UOQ95177.1 GNAT family N-acetyltransferase [Halobacillus shinanisalinarum]